MQKLARISTIVLATSSLMCAALALVAVAARAALPYQIDYEEGNILNAAVRITHGMTPYPDPHSWPNVLNPYGPVMYYVVAALVKVFGVTLVPGRLVVIGCGVVIAALVGLVVKRETGSAVTGAAFGALFLCSPIMQFWWPLLRVDLVGLALSLGGMVVFLSQYPTLGKRSRGWGTQEFEDNYATQTKRGLEWGTITAAALFVVAIFTKHTLVAAPAACVVWALVNGQRSAALKLGAWCVALGGVGFTIGEIATRGVLGFALFRTHPDPYRWSAYPEALQQVAAIHPLLVVLAAVLVVAQSVAPLVSSAKADSEDLHRSFPALTRWANEFRRFAAGPSVRMTALPLIYLAFCLATALTIGKAGSNFNHVLELIAALCMGAGTGWQYVAKLQGVRQLVTLAIAGLIVFLTVDQSRALAFEPRSSACEEVIGIIRQQPGSLVLSENTGAVVMAGKTPLISNTFVYTQLVKYGGWSDRELVEMLNSKSVPMVLMDAGRRQLWSREVIGALYANYRLQGKCDCRYAGLRFIPKQK